MGWLRLWVCVMLGLGAWRVAAQQDDDGCAPPSALIADVWARNTSDSPNNLRAEAGLAGERIGGIPAGDILRIIGSALCADGYAWLEVDYVGTQGWTAVSNADGSDAWVAPLTGQTWSQAVDDPVGCLRPPDDYTQISINGYATLNLRTLTMLDHAQALYSADGGIIRLRPAVMQGSYTNGAITASFGTHDGGGAVDISVRDLQTRQVLEREIEPLLMALRTAGFAAWLRSPDELYAGSVIHIHAIAVGDDELSDAAQAQVDGDYGYLRGFNGLPPEWGGPALDPLPIVRCAWMEG
jgi:hypothetical protein